MIEDAIAIAGSELTLLPEFYLLRGELLLAVPEAGNAEPWFQRAFDMATELDARMSQLRAAVRLCRLCRDQSNASEASQVLRAIYRTFTEGFATADLREANQLLAGYP